MTNFTYKVLEIVSKIPRGKTMTYASVAIAAGSPRAYRAVGNILHRNFRKRKEQLPRIRKRTIPCHRVICSDGLIGNYALGRKTKERILVMEGIKFEKHKIV
jgi:methylated-DNA-[protein]-cysteine S-methyltransferase